MTTIIDRALPVSPQTALSRSTHLIMPATPLSSDESSPNFSWGTYLNTTNSHAAPVNIFHHAPLNELWAQFAPGMKLEVVNTDCILDTNETTEQIFWFATVIRIEGYLVLLRYEGYDDDKSMDFWCNLSNKDIHCVGWCGQYGVKLVPPRSIEHRQTDWKTFLVNRLVGSKTLPDTFQQKIQASLRCPFKKDMMLEVIDKFRVSSMRIGKITEVIGGRLKIKYEDTTDEEFSVHYTSNLIHPIGWSARVGHEIEASKKSKAETNKRMEMNSSSSNMAPLSFFSQVQIPSSEDDHFKEGQKLEAVDPLDMSRICPATVAKVLQDGYFMLSIDGSSVEDGSDWFCYHSSSRLIFPINFCKLNQIPLSSPIGYQGKFQWDKYLLETNSVYAPQELFQVIKEKVVNPFTVGMKIEAVDMMAPQLVCVATIAQIADSLIKVHFDGWDNAFEQWIDCQSANIYPIGWCEFVGHKLEEPKQPDTSETSKSRTRKSHARKSNKRKRLS